MTPSTSSGVSVVVLRDTQPTAAAVAGWDGQGLSEVARGAGISKGNVVKWAMPERKRGKTEGGMGGSLRGKWRLRKGGSRSAIHALFTITEEEEGRRQRDTSSRKKKGIGGGVGKEN